MGRARGRNFFKELELRERMRARKLARLGEGLPQWVEPPPGRLRMTTVYQMGGVALMSHLEKWDPDPNSAWRLKSKNLMMGTGLWWRTVVSGVPKMHTISGRITSFSTFTGGHGPATFSVWSDEEQRFFSWINEPPREFSVGQPVEIDCVLGNDQGTGSYIQVEEVLEIRVGFAA
jgi:hypothetical protein